MNALIPENIMNALKLLSPEQRQEVFDFVAFLARKAKVLTPDREMETEVDPERSQKARVLGLHAGEGSVSKDFDEPLGTCK
jgi:hypothetical protein